MDNPHRTEYSMNKATKSVPTAGDQRPPSSPTDSRSLDPLSSTRQMPPPSPIDAQVQARGPPPRALSVTDSPAAVTPNNLQFAGDHRFPPGRPPIRSRPDPNAALSAGLAAWGDVITDRGTGTGPAAALEAIRKLLQSPHAAIDPLRTVLPQASFTEVDPATVRCDADSFRDPEHVIHSIIDNGCGAVPGDSQRGPFMTKKVMRRMLKGSRAGADRPAESADSQDRQDLTGTSGGTSNQGGLNHYPQLTRPQAPPPIPPLRQMVLRGRQMHSQMQQNALINAGPWHYVSRHAEYSPDLHAQRRQPETGEPLEGMDVNPMIPFHTPRDVRDMDLLLNGQAVVENHEEWLQRSIMRVITMWTERPTWQADSVRLTRLCSALGTADQPEPRFQVVEDDCAPARPPLLRICDAPRDVTAGGNLAGGMDARVGEGIPDSDKEVAQASPISGPDQADWPALPARTERQVPAAMIASTCLAAPSAGAVQQKDARSTHRRDCAPCAAMERQAETPLTPLTASAPPDPTFPSRPLRRRRGGRRGPKTSYPRSPTSAGGGGGDDSRGAQLSPSSSMLDASGRAATEEADSRLREHNTAAALLGTTPARGSTITVHEPGAARPLAWQVPEGGLMDSPERAGLSHGQEGTGSFQATLSQRREFQCKMADGVSATALAEGMSVSTYRGQRGRQVVDEDGRTGQPFPMVARSPRPGTREMAGTASELMCMGTAGLVSARLPAQAARRYYGPASPAGPRRRRGGRRHRRRNNKGGRDLSRDVGQDDRTGTQGAGPPSLVAPALLPRLPRYGPLLAVVDSSALGSVTRAEEAGREATAGLVAAGEESRLVCPSATGEPTPPTAAPARLFPRLAERWKKPLAVMGTGADAPSTAQVPWSGPEEGVGPRGASSVPDSVETRLVFGGVQLLLELTGDDWKRMQDIGL